MLILFFKYLIIYYLYIDLVYIKFVLKQASKLLLNCCLLFFKNLSFNFKFAYKKYNF